MVSRNGQTPMGQAGMVPQVIIGRFWNHDGEEVSVIPGAVAGVKVRTVEGCKPLHATIYYGTAGSAFDEVHVQSYDQLMGIIFGNIGLRDGRIDSAGNTPPPPPVIHGPEGLALP